jgi:hypothetical protein
MGRRKRNDGKRFSKAVMVHMTPEQHDEAKQMAADAGTRSVGELFRRRVFKPQRGTKVSAEVINKVLWHLGKTGTNLNQIARHLNSTGHLSRIDFDECMAALKAAYNRVLDL